MLTEEQYQKAMEVLIAKARTDFLTYFHLFNPQGAGAIILGDLHRYLIELTQQVYEGGEDRANNAVSVPPQHGKSTILSVEAPSWLLGVSPSISIAITGFSYSLVTKFSKAIRSRLEHPLYQIIFPGVYPAKGSNKEDEWETATGGSVIAKSSGAKLTGRRVDWLIMDDVHPGRAEAESPSLRRKVIEWYFADCLTRLHPKAKTFLVGTRWHPHDLIGHLTSPEYQAELDQEQSSRKFTKVNIPAIAEEGVPDPLNREAGAALFPEERPLTYLKSIKAAIPSYEWDSQYQGKPRSAAGGQIDLTNLRYLTPDSIPWDDIDEIVRGWDLAMSEKQTADYTAGALVGINWETRALYLLHVYRRRMAWAKMRKAILDTAAIDLRGYPANKIIPPRKVLRVGLEGVAGFKGVVEDVRQELLGTIKVELRNPPPRSEGGGSKLLRAQPWLNKLEKGLVYVVRGDWTKDFIDELDHFPDGPKDDQIDAVSIANEMFDRRAQLLIA